MKISLCMLVGLVVGVLVVIAGIVLLATNKHLYNYDKCTCANGEFAIKDACAVDGSEFCLSCDNGYYLSTTPSTNNTCLENECRCLNGGGEINTECPSHRDFKCETCNNGYFLDDFMCPLKVCTCANGDGSTGTNCPSNGDAKCRTCDNGYHLNGIVCELNQCTCNNGDGTTGLNCLTNGAAKCGSCDTANAFNLRGNACESRGCSASAVNMALDDVMYVDCTGCSTAGSVWGSGVYTGDSSICRAAAHENRSGVVMVVKKAGRPSYTGETRNGITTSNYGSFRLSFMFEPDVVGFGLRK